MRISEWSSDVCSSDLVRNGHSSRLGKEPSAFAARVARGSNHCPCRALGRRAWRRILRQPLRRRQMMFKRPSTHYGKRSEEHTSELQSLMRISYAVFCLKKKNTEYRITTKKLEHQNHKN